MLDTVDRIETAVLERVPLWNDRTEDHGPFDIIGDVHGCGGELEELLHRLGYTCAVHEATSAPPFGAQWYAHPNRKAVFVGDLVDRGPRIVDTVKIVMNMVAMGSALCVPGNHDIKLAHCAGGQQIW